MTYVKTDWETGDIITAEKLNNIENGVANIGAGVFFIDYTRTQGIPQVTTLTKTWNEIMNAVTAGMCPVVKHNYGTSVVFTQVTDIGGEEGVEYFVNMGISTNQMRLTCSDPDGYPTYSYYPA